MTNSRDDKNRAALILAQAVLRRWTDLYAKLQNESGEVVSRRLDYNLPPGDHVRALEAIAEALECAPFAERYGHGFGGMLESVGPTPSHGGTSKLADDLDEEAADLDRQHIARAASLMRHAAHRLRSMPSAIQHSDARYQRAVIGMVRYLTRDWYSESDRISEALRVAGTVLGDRVGELNPPFGANANECKGAWRTDHGDIWYCACGGKSPNDCRPCPECKGTTRAIEFGVPGECYVCKGTGRVSK